MTEPYTLFGTDHPEIEFPRTGFTGEYNIERLNPPTITFVVKRDVVSPLLLTNSEDQRAESEEINGTVRAQSNPEKFVSKERLTGLQLLRELDEEDTDSPLVADGYRYTKADTWQEAMNLDPLVYGIAGVDNETFTLKSHVVEGYTYTSDEYRRSREIRNEANESGSMQEHNPDADAVHDHFDNSSALYTHSPVRPGNSFIHFVTVEDALPGMVLYVLHNLLNTDQYGARETRHGRNIRNQVVGVVQSDDAASMSTWELLELYDSDDQDITESVTDYITDLSSHRWDIYLDGVDDYSTMPTWLDAILPIATYSDPASHDKLATAFSQTTQQIRSDIQMGADSGESG
jgi:CRISPR-associated protein Csc2